MAAVIRSEDSGRGGGSVILCSKSAFLVKEKGVLGEQVSQMISKSRNRNKRSSRNRCRSTSENCENCEN